MAAAAALAIMAFSPPADDTPVTEVTGPEIATAALILLYSSANCLLFTATRALAVACAHGTAYAPDPLVLSLKVQLYRFELLLILVSVAFEMSTAQLPKPLYVRSAVWNPLLTVLFSVSVTVALLLVEFVVTTVISKAPALTRLAPHAASIATVFKKEVILDGW